MASDMQTNTSNSISRTRATAAFRTTAFRVFYDGVFADVEDHTERFVCAIISSARVTNDRNLLQAWWVWTRGRWMKAVPASNVEPPQELRPFVEAYVRAVGERAKQAGVDVAHPI